MSLKTYRFSSLNEMNNFLNGVVVGKALPPVVYGLLGLKLKLKQPVAAEYTFTAGARTDGGLTHAEIKSKLEAAFTGLVVGYQGTFIALSGGSAGVEFDAESKDVSAAPLLGFTFKAGGKTLSYAAPDGSPPRLIQAFGVGTGFGVIVEES